MKNSRGPHAFELGMRTLLALLASVGCTSDRVPPVAHDRGSAAVVMIDARPVMETIDGFGELTLGMTEGQVFEALTRSGTQFTHDGGATGYFTTPRGGVEVSFVHAAFTRDGQTARLELRNGVLDSIYRTRRLASDGEVTRALARLEQELGKPQFEQADVPADRDVLRAQWSTMAAVLEVRTARDPQGIVLALSQRRLPYSLP